MLVLKELVPIVLVAKELLPIVLVPKDLAQIMLLPKEFLSKFLGRKWTKNGPEDHKQTINKP